MQMDASQKCLTRAAARRFGAAGVTLNFAAKASKLLKLRARLIVKMSGKVDDQQL